MTVFGDQVAALAESTSVSVQAAYARLVAGEITEAAFVELATTSLSIGDARAAALADEGLAATLSRQARTVVVPLGIPAPDPPDGLLATLIRAALADPAPGRAIDIAARGRTLETAHYAEVSGLESHGVEFWTRVPNTGACPACKRLGGVVLPMTTKMWRHTGCACTQTPATPAEKEQSDAQRSAAAKRAAATRRANADRERARNAARADRQRQRRADARNDPARVARSEANRADARARADAILAAAGVTRG